MPKRRGFHLGGLTFEEALKRALSTPPMRKKRAKRKRRPKPS